MKTNTLIVKHKCYTQTLNRVPLTVLLTSYTQPVEDSVAIT